MERQTRTALMWGAAGAGLWLAAREAIHWQRWLDLRDRTVLITGGSRGLGLVLARHVLAAGGRVAICARDESELEGARADLQVTSRRILTVPCDLADRDQAESMVQRVQDYFGAVNVLINNAGVIEVGPLETMTLHDFEEAMQINFWGAVYTTLAVLPRMRQRRQGRIVNISSIGGKVSVPHLLPYCASKFALTGFSEGLRIELAKDQIYVTTICPHLMRTGSPPNADFKGQHRAEYAWFSLSDSLPGISMSADHAARRILRACQRGEPEVILTLQANLAARVYALFPGLASEVLSLVNQTMPGPGGIGTERAKGKESYSRLSPSVLTTLGDRASQRNNENP